MKRVLHIIDSGGLYGAEVMLLNLAAEQVKLGLKPIIASIGEKGLSEKPFEAEAIKRGLNVQKFRMRPWLNCFGALKILKFAKKQQVDALHSHGYKGNILFGPLPRAIRGMPLITTVHGYTSTKGWSKMRIYELLDSWSLQIIDAVVLVNRGMLNHRNLKNLNKSQIHIIDNGIPITDTSFDSPLPRQPKTDTSGTDSKIVDFCRQGYIVGTIGRYSSEKGYSNLVKAVSILVKQGVNAKLIIIGEGSERQLLGQLSEELNIADRVLLTGYRKNASCYIPLFNVYAISSLTEGLPITLLEAMRSEVPVVATKVGGIPDVLPDGKAGILVQPEDPTQLATAFKKIYNNKKLSVEFTDYAYNRLMNNYSSKGMALKYSDLYNELLDNT